MGGITLASVNSQQVPGGMVHGLPADLCTALSASVAALAAWTGVTRAQRVICRIEDAKQQTTRKRRGGAGGRSAPALLLARVQAPRAHRQVRALRRLA